ncbi:MAG TPA: hypothetical protein VMV31_09440 [Terriglobales bacterium]|nr:hypothetical protein [Terriglobales bacterium]
MPTPRRFRVRAYAKLNLGLKLVGRRADGFHELRTIFQTIALADRVEIAIGPGRGVGLEVVGDDHGVGPEAENLAVRAAGLAAEAWDIRGHIAIRLEKRIPVGAGLGGGSSDAAAVLRALALAARRPTPLLPLAARLGSDVPPLLVGGTVLGLGRGEEVYPLPDLGRWHCVLAMPRHGPGAAVSTAAAFAAWDRGRGLTPFTDFDTIMEFCRLVDQVLPAFRLGRNRGAPPAPRKGAGGPRVHAGIENDFQTGVFSLSPDFPRIHRQLVRSHAAWVSLTGSGAAQFGLYAQAGRAQRAAAGLAVRERSWHSRFLGRAEFHRGLRVVE